IDNIELPQLGQKVVVQHGPLFDHPVIIAREISSTQLISARHRLRIIIERVNARAKPSRREAEKPTSTAYIEKTAPIQPALGEHPLQRLFCEFDALLIDYCQKSSPVSTELETLPGPNFSD